MSSKNTSKSGRTEVVWGLALTQFKTWNVPFRRFGQKTPACQHMDNELDRHSFAMKDRPMMLWKVAIAGRTVQLAPRATTGMAVGAQVTEPQPAAIATASMGTEVSGGV